MAERTVQQPVAAATQQRFSDLPTADTERSTFDMSHSWKGTTDTNKLVPVLCQEILPGDTFNVSSTFFLRLATPIKPLMDSLSADIHYFFVPNRLVWDNWQKFMGERSNVDDDPSDYSIPQANVDFNIRNSSGELPDFFGLPLVDPGNDDPVIHQVCTLPFRAYQLIFNEWYRNQSIINEQPIPTGDGPDDIDYGFDWDDPTDLGNIFRRHKYGDYFTRALPWPQKGDPVFLPLGTSAPIRTGEAGQPYTFITSTEDEKIALVRDANDPQEVAYELEGGGVLDPGRRFYPYMRADLSLATAASINDMRTAFQVQKLLERDARGGTRYIEIILSHFNVQSPDARLQRPEYLGGGGNKIIVNPVAATVATTEAPQGNLAAVGTGLVKAGFNHSFTEHGYILGIMSCRADLTYQTGLDRMWTRQTRYEYYWPALSHLGEQAIKNKEIYFQGNATDEETWGYQERYAEYRYAPSRITGKFRSRDPESLDIWHLSQDLVELPPLNFTFVSDAPPIDRVVAVPSEPDLLVDGWHDMKATRPMPVYAVPGLVDHF